MFTGYPQNNGSSCNRALPVGGVTCFLSPFGSSPATIRVLLLLLLLVHQSNVCDLVTRVGAASSSSPSPSAGPTSPPCPKSPLVIASLMMIAVPVGGKLDDDNRPLNLHTSLLVCPSVCVVLFLLTIFCRSLTTRLPPLRLCRLRCCHCHPQLMVFPRGTQTTP